MRLFVSTTVPQNAIALLRVLVRVEAQKSNLFSASVLRPYATYVCRSVTMCRCVDAHLGAVFRSGEDAHLCRSVLGVNASARRRKRAQDQERKFDAETPRSFGPPP